MITSEAIDPEAPLGVMDDEGNIVVTPTDANTAVGGQGQRAISRERIIDAGHVEKCVTDVRELVCTLFQLQSIIVTLFQALSSDGVGIEKTQPLPPTQQMGEEEIEEGSGPVPMTQASALAGISHGVETQILKTMFDSLPPSSQIMELEMLGPSVFRTRIRGDLTRFRRS